MDELNSMQAVHTTDLLNLTLPLLLKVIGEQYSTLADDDLVSLLSQLKSFGLSTQHEVVRKMFQRTLSRLDDLSLQSLVRMLLTSSSPELNFSTKGRFVPVVSRFVDECSSLSDLHLLCYCVRVVQSVSNDDMARRHANKMNQFLDDENFCFEQNSDLLFAILRFFCSHSVDAYSSTVERVAKILVDRTEDFKLNELLDLKIFCRTYKVNRNFSSKLHEQALKSLESVNSTSLMLELFMCLSPKVFQEKKEQLDKAIKSVISSSDNISQFLSVYHALRVSGSIDVSSVDDYWNKSYALVKEECQHTENHMKREAALGEVYNRYLYFNNNLGGTYRNWNLEQELISILTDEINGASGILIHKFCRMAAFVIAYSEPGEIPSSILERLSNMCNQLSVDEVEQLTHGMQVGKSLLSISVFFITAYFWYKMPLRSRYCPIQLFYYGFYLSGEYVRSSLTLL